MFGSFSVTSKLVRSVVLFTLGVVMVAIDSCKIRVNRVGETTALGGRIDVQRAGVEVQLLLMMRTE